MALHLTTLPTTPNVSYSPPSMVYSMQIEARDFEMEDHFDMATVEERLTALEQSRDVYEQKYEALARENEALKIAVNALATRSAFDGLVKEVNDIKVDVIKGIGRTDGLYQLNEANQRFWQLQFDEIRDNIAKGDGRLAAFETDVMARFAQHQGQTSEIAGNVVGLQTEMRQRFSTQDNVLKQILDRLPEKP